MRIDRLLAVIGLFLLLALPARAQGQSFPSKPIRVVVPFGPGGTGDLVARAIASKIGETLGYQVLIENKPGAGGAVAGQEVARATPDGHTLLLISNGTAVSKALFKSLPYEPLNDFSMISTAAWFGLVIATHPQSQANTVKEFIALAKASPGKMNIATINIGSTQNLAAELFKSIAGIDAQIVPYKTSGDVIVAAKNQDAHVIFDFFAPTLSHLKSGGLKPLAVTTAKRFPGLPDVPTAIESGLPGFDVASWNGFAAPAKTPRAVIDRLQQAIAKAVAAPDVQKRFLELGVEGRSSTPEQLRDLFVSESRRWSAVVEAARIPKQ
ncbi:MAG TPA: tripartite tricarboxylate transporter substrate binding protein [Myxococcaceae bacterium]|nr:tripartite tricarboxylate transporter substrate binding protein [Myxococcaceae bacterium]